MEIQNITTFFSSILIKGRKKNIITMPENFIYIFITLKTVGHVKEIKKKKKLFTPHYFFLNFAGILKNFSL